MPPMTLEKKTALVLGAGKTGCAAALFLAGRGARARLLDDGPGPDPAAAEKLAAAGVEIMRKGRGRDFEKGAALLVPSPGVPPEHPVIRRALALGVPVRSEIELAAGFCPAPILAVTGTNGKSTVVTMLAAMLAEAGRKVHLAGNIGTPFIGALGDIGAGDLAVLEVSSFQLEWVSAFRPRVAVLLNITPDHLDRYPDFAAYRAAKERLFAAQGEGDCALVNYDDPGARACAVPGRARRLFYRRAGPGPAGGFVLEGRTVRLPSGEPLLEIPAGAPPGAHNEENIAAACAAAFLAGAGAEAMTRALSGFRPLAHRMEEAAARNGVRYVDDSKATNIDAARRAVESFPAGEPRLVLIMGGRDKGGGYRALRPAFAGRVKALVLIGEAAALIGKELSGAAPARRAADMDEAVRAAASLAAPGDTVLLSPACSSFDMFRDYAARGEAFRAAARKLPGGKR